MSEYIENLLDSFYSRISPGVVNEIVLYVTKNDISDDDFSRALSDYRLTEDYAPTLRKLLPFLQRKTYENRTNPHIFRAFFSMVESYGWSYAVRKAIDYGCGLGGMEAAQLRSFFLANHITPEHKLFEAERLFFPEEGMWYTEYLRILHEECDPLKAVTWASEHASPDETRTYYLRKKSWYEGVPFEQLKMNWPYFYRSRQ